MFDPSLQTIWGGGNLTAVFCDTGWEHPDTYKHVNDVCLQMGVRLITLKSKYDFVSLAVHKKRFPSTNARFCTSELKMKPMIDYVLSLKESCIIIQGIRAGESTARAAMEEECMYFKSYFQPNKKGRTENYRSKDVKEWCSQFDASVLRPIFKWSAQQVIDCILDAGQKPNPLYYRGFSRVGCFPCIMCRHKEIELIANHKARGDQVEWYNPLCEYDKVYAAKVFTFTPDYNYYINTNQIEKGGTGYDIEKVLPVEVDRLQPDYSIYNIDSNLSYGFLTRGCPNRCKWCVVPKKEGKISPYMDIEEITAGRKKAILMDNNILASNYGLQQIEKIIKLGIKVDFNQGLDARLITDEIARLLAKVKWIKRIRFGCDTPGQIAEVERASALIDKYGYKGEYFLYCILMDFKESFARVNYWKSKSRRFLPHCQPFRDLNNPHQIIPQWHKDMAHWADRKEIYMSCDFKDFSPRKGFLCKEYFKML